MTLHDQLDEVLFKALEENPCECKTDDFWSQDIKGQIHCRRCGKQIAENL